MSRLPIFVYGTLRPGCGNDGLWRGDAEPLHDGACWVNGYRLIGRNRGFPYMVADDGSTTVGTLIEPYAAIYYRTLDRMDALEGTPEHYVRVHVVVHHDGGPTLAWAYIPSATTRARLVEYGTAPTAVDDDGRYDWHAERGAARR